MAWKPVSRAAADLASTTTASSALPALRMPAAGSDATYVPAKAPVSAGEPVTVALGAGLMSGAAGEGVETLTGAEWWRAPAPRDLKRRVEEWKRKALEIAERLEPSPQGFEEGWDYYDEEYARRKLGL
jgi:hypothetical protein